MIRRIRYGTFLSILILTLISICSNATETARKDGVLTGKATYYTTASCQSEGTSGVYTANGEHFDENAFTCAMRRRDWGSQFNVTNLANGKSVTVRLNDFGPGRGPSSKGVIIDLSPAAWIALGVTTKTGSLNVIVEPIASPHQRLDSISPPLAVAARPQRTTKRPEQRPLDLMPF